MRPLSARLATRASLDGPEEAQAMSRLGLFRGRAPERYRRKKDGRPTMTRSGRQARQKRRPRFKGPGEVTGPPRSHSCLMDEELLRNIAWDLECSQRGVKHQSFYCSNSISIEEGQHVEYNGKDDDITRQVSPSIPKYTPLPFFGEFWHFSHAFPIRVSVRIRGFAALLLPVRAAQDLSLSGSRCDSLSHHPMLSYAILLSPLDPTFALLPLSFRT